jgi:hypothetical protein
MGDKVHAAHGRFRCVESDAVSALQALLAYEAEAPAKRSLFCKQHWLHESHLSEMAALHAQLRRAVCLPSVLLAAQKAGLGSADVLERLASSDALTRCKHLQRPGANSTALLRRCIVAGWPDQVARRMRTAEYLDQLAAQVRQHMFCSSDATIRSTTHAQRPRNGSVAERWVMVMVNMQLLKNLSGHVTSLRVTAGERDQSRSISAMCPGRHRVSAPSLVLAQASTGVRGLRGAGEE